jgi:hypothetical protein
LTGTSKIPGASLSFLIDVFPEEKNFARGCHIDGGASTNVWN